MFYRRKILFSLLQLFDGKLERTRLQKLLFLFSQRQIRPQYFFVPFRFGCYSFSASADLSKMVSHGMIRESKSGFEKVDNTDYIKQLTPEDSVLLHEIKTLFGKMGKNVLVKHTYLNYPYYATKSEILDEILSHEERKMIYSVNSVEEESVLFTIGYEGISLEEYLMRLLKNNVKMLIDVRRNPLSMKFGFSKSQLKRFCENLGIMYFHIPEVGIQSSSRQELNTQGDYDLLFNSYIRDSLPNTVQSQFQILTLLKEHKRVALTCFESDICRCHRKYLAEAIEKLSEFNFEIRHI